MPETIKILIAAVLPAFVLIYYIYRKDKYQREPVRQLLKAFGYGILSVFVVLWIFGPAISMVSIAEPSTAFGAFWNAFLTAGIPEELAKLLCLWLFLRKNPYFDEYIDGIVYAVCVGMGFAAFENVGYLFSNVEAWREIGLLRGNPRSRGWNFTLALMVPVLLHGLFDALLMTSDAVGGSASAIMLFGGLWFYMFSTSKKRIREHLKNS